MYLPAVLIAAALMEFVLPLQAQDTRESGGLPVYKVEFNIRGGFDGKSPTLHYSMLIDESRRAAFQAASRVPIEGGTPPFVEVGMSVELGVRASDGKVTLDGVIELSSVTGQACMGAICEPIVGQKKVAFNTTIPLAAPTAIDQTGAPGTLPSGAMRQVEVVVTKAN